MLPITHGSRAAQARAAARPLLTLSPSSSCSRRRTASPFHTKASPRLSSAEAAPAARPAKHESDRGARAIDGIAARRVKAGKLVAGIAAASDSDMFKGSVSWGFCELTLSLHAFDKLILTVSLMSD